MHLEQEAEAFLQRGDHGLLAFADLRERALLQHVLEEVVVGHGEVGFQFQQEDRHARHDGEEGEVNDAVIDGRRVQEASDLLGHGVEPPEEEFVDPDAEVVAQAADGELPVTAEAAQERGVAGEFCTRGYSVMLGYWDDEEKTTQSIDKNGWMHTGDLATMDDDGYCNIVGRIKDMVIRGGENVYPREIEEFLYRHPKVQDVQVVGVPDRQYGEQLCAWVVVKPGQTLSEDELRAFCKGQIAHYKVPRHIRFVTEFPMTVTGKMQKFIMPEQMAHELGVDESKTA